MHALIITMLYCHWEPCNKAVSKSLAQCISRIRTVNPSVPSVMAIQLCHSPRFFLMKILRVVGVHPALYLEGKISSQKLNSEESVLKY